MNSKYQAGLEFLIIYGSALLIMSIVGSSLYGMGFFNPSSSTALQVKGLSYFHIEDALLDSNGTFKLLIGLKTGETTTITNIDYDVEGYSCLNSINEQDFTITPSEFFLASFSPNTGCSLVEGSMVEMNISIHYIKGSGLEHIDKGRVRILVQKIGYSNLSINLISPANNSELSSNSINFEYNVTNFNPISNCTIYIDDLQDSDWDDLGGQTFSIGIEEDVLVTADTYGGVGLGVFDISDKSNPNKTFTNSFSAGGVDIEDGFAFITDYTNSLLKIYNVTNPYNISFINQLSVGSIPVPVEVQDGYAYPQEYSGSNMYVVNVTNPSSPSLVSTISLSATTPYGNGVKVIQNTLFVATSDGKVTIYNISDKSNPNQIKQYSYSGNPDITGIDVDKKYVYIADYTDNKLSILNNPCDSFNIISCNNNWTEIGSSAENGGFTKPRYLDVKGDFVFFARHANPGAIQVYDVSDRTNPRLIDTNSVYNGPNCVESVNNYVYSGLNTGALETQLFNITSNTDSSITLNTPLSFTEEVYGTSHKWFITCEDTEGNKGSSSIYNFEIE